MGCPSCGTNVAEGARFCPSCGTALERRAEERRVVTVVFADLVGFTSFAERRDPERVKNLVDRCFERLVVDIEAYGGKVDKILGDAIVALFGAPTAHEDDAERAVRAGLQMQHTLAAWRSSSGAADLRMRIGINTGEVLVGALRAGGDYTAMGDTVNTAQRLQTAAEPGQVVVGPDTFSATRRVVSYRSLGAVQAKGREAPVDAWIAEEVILPPGARPGHAETPIVGREHEIDVLNRAIDATVARRRAQLILIVAEAGMGKTRLAGEVAARAGNDHNAAVLDGRCVPYGEANVWYPVADALRASVGLRVGDSYEAARTRTGERVRQALRAAPDAEIERVTTGLMHVLGYDGPLAGIEPARAREEMTRSIVAYVEGFARQFPVVVVFSDLHWADDTVLELADSLLERVANLPYVLVATARSSLLERWTPKSGRHNQLVLNLDPLDRSAAGELLDRLAGDVPLAPDLREVLLDRSGGNPFFLEELIALVRESGGVDAIGGPGGNGAPAAVIDSGTSLYNGELPHTLRGLVSARLDALTHDERCTVENAAVLGRRGTTEALELMGSKDHGHGPIDVSAGLEGLAAKDVLVVEDGKWTFRSEVVREVAYGMLTKADRARRHAGVAGWLEDHTSGSEADVDRIAHHWATAADLVIDLGGIDILTVEATRERALAWLDRALAQAQAGELHLVAVRLATRALGLGGDSRQRLRFLLARAKAHTNLRELEAATADAADAASVADVLGDPAAQAAVLVIRGEVEQKAGHLDVSSVTLHEAVQLFRSVGDEQGMAEALRSYGMTRLFCDDERGAAASFAEALSAFQSIGDRRGEAWALQNLAWVAYMSGKAEEAERWLEASIGTFTEIGDNGGLGWAKGLLAFVRYHQGRYDEAETMARAMVVEADERGDAWAASMLRSLLGSVALWTGRTMEAVEHGETAMGAFRELNDWYGESLSVGVYGRALLAAGRVDDGMAVLRDTVHRARAAGNTPAGDMAMVHVTTGAAQAGLPELSRDPAGDWDRAANAHEHEGEIGWQDLCVAQSLIALQEGEPGAMRERLERAVGPDDSFSAYAAAGLTLVRAGCGAVTEARAMAQRVLAHDRATYSDRVLSLLGSALAAARAGDAEAARCDLTTAHEHVDPTGDRLLQAIVRLAEARVAVHRGDDGGPDALRRAHLAMAALGASEPGWDTAFQTILGSQAQGAPAGAP